MLAGVFDSARLPALCHRCAAAAACASAPPTPRRRMIPGIGPPMVDPSAGLEEVSIRPCPWLARPLSPRRQCTPDSGFDCSGLVRYVVLRAANVNPAAHHRGHGRPRVALERSQVASGDLVFFNATGRANSHVSQWHLASGRTCFVPCGFPPPAARCALRTWADPIGPPATTVPGLVATGQHALLRSMPQREARSISCAAGPGGRRPHRRIFANR
ncbi:NlpC/P60 family protein [Cupriavidus basilensis]